MKKLMEKKLRLVQNLKELVQLNLLKIKFKSLREMIQIAITNLMIHKIQILKLKPKNQMQKKQRMKLLVQNKLELKTMNHLKRNKMRLFPMNRTIVVKLESPIKLRMIQFKTMILIINLIPNLKTTLIQTLVAKVQTQTIPRLLMVTKKI